MKFESVKAGQVYYERTDYHIYFFVPTRVSKTSRGLKQFVGLEILDSFSGQVQVGTGYYNEMNWRTGYNRKPIALGKPDKLTDQEMRRAIKAVMEKK